MPLPIQVYRMYVAFSSFFFCKLILVFIFSPFSPHSCYPSLKSYTIPTHTMRYIELKSQSATTQVAQDFLPPQVLYLMYNNQKWKAGAGINMCFQSGTLALLLDLSLLLSSWLCYQQLTIIKQLQFFFFLKSVFISGKRYFLTHVLPKKHFEGKAFKNILP